MKTSPPSVDDLVSQFAEIATRMGVEGLYGSISVYNRLYDKMRTIEQELKSMQGDQRSALLRLYDHPDMEVRLLAAKATRSIAEREARMALERIRDSDWPQKLDAGMALHAWDDGIWQAD